MAWKTLLTSAGSSVAGLGAAGLAAIYLAPASILDTVPGYAVPVLVAMLVAGCITVLIVQIPPRVRRVETGRCRDCPNVAPSFNVLERRGWTGAPEGGFLCPDCRRIRGL